MLDWETQTQYEVLERGVEKGVSREPSSQFRVHRQAERPCPECPQPLPRWGPPSPGTTIRGRWGSTSVVSSPWGLKADTIKDQKDPCFRERCPTGRESALTLL